ncbi:unnamed protein product, partial [Heterosigma akashiwo]
GDGRLLGPFAEEKKRTLCSWRGRWGVLLLPQPKRKKNKKSGKTERNQHGRPPKQHEGEKCCRDHQIDLKIKNEPQLLYFYYLPIIRETDLVNKHMTTVLRY